MWRILLFFVLVTLGALGFSWLADNPGTVDIKWQGHYVPLSIMMVVIGFLASLATVMLLWWLIKNVIFAPGKVSQAVKLKNREKGIDAVSRGLIAVSAGDAALARKLSAKAGKKLQSDGLTTLLKAQAAQLSGDRNTARRLYEAMLENPETEIAGLRGLYLEARREKEIEAARQFAQKAVARNPQLSWSNQALLEIQSRSGQWGEALKTLEIARKNKKIDKHTAQRQRAVLLTAQALQNEQHDMDAALDQALEAHKLAPDLIPAANIAGRLLAAQGNVRKASKIILATWDSSPHPDLALTYAHARPGDSPRDRLTRVRQLADRSPHNMEGPIAVAEAAIESHDWDEGRAALKSLLADRPSKRVCTLMARIEGGEFGDKGRVREWLARTMRAPRDPAWIADGYISEVWAPISPITGQLDAFDWKVPQEQLEHKDEELPFDDFIPLKAEQNAEPVVEEAPEAITATAAPVAAAAATAAAATVGVQTTAKAAAQASETAEILQTSSEPKSIKTPETDRTRATAEPEKAPATSEKSEPATDRDPIVDGAETKAELLPKDSASDLRDNVEDAQIIEAELVEEPAAVKAAKAKEEAEQAQDQSDKRGQSDKAGQSDKKAQSTGAAEIYMPPRLPDDPGPLGSSTGSKNQKLPQRFRHSRS